MAFLPHAFISFFGREKSLAPSGRSNELPRSSASLDSLPSRLLNRSASNIRWWSGLSCNPGCSIERLRCGYRRTGNDEVVRRFRYLRFRFCGSGSPAIAGRVTMRGLLPFLSSHFPGGRCCGNGVAIATRVTVKELWFFHSSQKSNPYIDMGYGASGACRR